MPDDFRTKIVAAEDFIEQQSHEMNGISVAMNENGTPVRDHSMRRPQPLKQEFSVLLLGRPTIFKGKLLRTIAWREPLSFLSEKGRVKICEVNASAFHLVQEGQAVAQPDLDFSSWGHFLAPGFSESRKDQRPSAASHNPKQHRQSSIGR